MIAVSAIIVPLQKELGSFFSTEAHKSNDLFRYLNSAARAITIARNFQFWKKTHKLIVLEGVTSYDIPFQIETKFVKDQSWTDVDFEDFFNYHNLDNKNSILCIDWDKAECNTPWEYNIFFRWFPSQINSTEDSINIPEHFFDLLLLKATYFWLMDVKAFSKAKKKDEIFEWMIKDMATRSSNPQPWKKKRLNKSKSRSF